MRHEMDDPGGQSSDTLGWRGGMLLAVVALCVLVPGIQVSFFDRDEGWYAQVSREMVESGDWLTPRYLGEVWLAKPPLLYWLTAGSFRVLGMGEWQARLVPVLAGCVVVVLTGALGARLFGRRVGVLAGLLLATTGLFSIVGKMLLTDGPMLACTLGAVLVHWRMATGWGLDGESLQRSDPPWPPLAKGGNYPWLPLATASLRLAKGGTWSGIYWVLIGVGVLAKGPATLVFAGAFGFGLLVAGWRRWLWSVRYWVALPLAIAVAAPWYVWMARQARGTLVEQFLWYEILSRITGAPHGHGGPPGYYLLLSLAGWLPWTVFIPGVVLAAWAQRKDPRVRLLLVWLALPWIVLELIHAKLPHYILPCYVPLAILLARQLASVWDRAGLFDSANPAERGVLTLWPRVMIALGVLVVVAGFLVPSGSVGRPLATVGMVLMVGFVAVGYLLRRGTMRWAFTGAVVVTVVLQVGLGWLLLPSLEPLRLSRQVAGTINRLHSPGMPVLLCGYDEPTTYFYLDALARPVAPEELGDRIKSLGQPAVVAIASKAFDSLPPETAATLFAQGEGGRIVGFNYVKMETTVVRVGRSGAVPGSMSAR